MEVKVNTTIDFKPGNITVENNVNNKTNEFVCEFCGFVGKNIRSLTMHKTKKHYYENYGKIITAETIKKIIELYPTHTVKQLSQILNISYFKM